MAIEPICGISASLKKLDMDLAACLSIGRDMAHNISANDPGDQIQALFAIMTGHAEDLADLAAQGQARNLDQAQIRALSAASGTHVDRIGECCNEIDALMLCISRRPRHR